MNHPIPVLDPSVPCLPPRISASGNPQWDPATFIAHRLPLSNRLYGPRDLGQPEAPKPTHKRARRKPRS